MSKKRCAHLAGFAMLLVWGTVTAWGAASASVSGEVRDSAGVPQIGAEVQLLRPDLSVIASVYTNSKGQFLIASVAPGRYALKAMDASFLPSLRENVRVHSATVVNLTLNTLYEVMQWLPAEARGGQARKDDWAWTLRSAANRPLLRWLENGPLMVVTDGPGAAPRLKARILATGEAGTFGESGERISASVENTPSDSQELLARVDFAPGTDRAMESMLGFRQDLGFVGSVQSVAAVAIHPEVEDTNGTGLVEASIRSWETMNLGPDLQAEVGTTEVLGRRMGFAPDTLIQGLPFATVEWHTGNNAVSYRMATMTTAAQAPSGDETAAAVWLPRFAARDGQLVLEHGMHQEIGWARRTTNTGVSVLVYNDNIQNPAMEAMARGAASGAALPALASGSLFDAASGLLRTAGPAFSSTGMQASYERRFAGGNRIWLSYANGAALVMPALPAATPLAQLIGAARPRHVQTYALSLSGTLDGTGTRWRASYRWQPDDTLTSVAPYAVDAVAPYLNLHFAQPIHLTRDGTGGLEAMLDVRNLLAQGYQPYVLSDGSVLIFAQNQRGFRGGLAFTF